ncbi:MAG: endonuclease domain-containing protein [Erythrobacter sp.]|nr:endonuclease domain-containing protein [Erythrobacter sp.]
MPEWKLRNTARARELRNAATPAERRLWEYLAKGQLGAKFSRQMPIGPWFADFLCRELDLVIEIDGFSHDVQPYRDLQRDADLQARGYSVLHFGNEEVMQDAEAVARAIQLKVQELRAVR